MTGTIQGQQLTVLIDSGSTHNFVYEVFADKLGIPFSNLSEFWVFIGSGEFLVCCSVCKNVPISIQGVSIVQDLFVLTMEGTNFVLGIQ